MCIWFFYVQGLLIFFLKKLDPVGQLYWYPLGLIIKSWKKKQFGDPKRIKNQETDPMRNNPVTLKNGGGQSLTPYEKMLKSV